MILGADGKPVTGKPSIEGTVSITRSFSYKLNLGDYQSADFFCSQRAECAPDMVDEVSSDLDQWCQDEVAEAIKQFKARRAQKIEAQRAGKSAA